LAIEPVDAPLEKIVVVVKNRTRNTEARRKHSEESRSITKSGRKQTAEQQCTGSRQRSDPRRNVCGMHSHLL